MGNESTAVSLLASQKRTGYYNGILFFVFWETVYLRLFRYAQQHVFTLILMSTKCCCLLISDVMHNRSFLLLDIGGLQILILCDGIEAGAVLVDIGQVTVAEDPGIGVRGLQLFQQFQQGAFLPRGTGVGGVAVLVQATFVADAQ